MPTDMDTIKVALKNARQSLHQARQKAEQLRQDYLEQRANLYDALEQQGKKKAVERLKQAEALSRIYTKLNRIRQTTHPKGVGEIQIPKDPTCHPKDCHPAAEHWQTITVPAEIEALLLRCNQAHFGQAKGTPFVSGQLSLELNYDGMGPAADLILDGTYQTTNLNPATRLLITHLRKKHDVILTGNITTKQFIDKLKR